MDTFFIIIISIILIIITIFAIGFGYLLAKIKIAKENKKILKDLGKVLDNKKENVLRIDGEEYPAQNFILKDKEDREYLLDLKGGKKIIKNAKPKEEERSEVKDSPIIREDSRSLREKKRDIGTRSRRIRRFG